MLKSCLILVIVLALAALGAGHFKVKEKIDGLNMDLEAARRAEQQARAAESIAKNKAKELETEKEKLEGDLAETQNLLEDQTRIAQQQRSRAEELESDLRSTTIERNEAQQKLAQWNALGIDIQAAQSMKNDLVAAREEILAGKAERTILLRQIEQIKYDLSKYEGPDIEVVMREGLKGSVVAVDDEWDFVVVSVGEKDGARQSGKLMVSRQGKLVGKVQITSLDENQSIANILPNWKQGDIQVGDTVLY